MVMAATIFERLDRKQLQPTEAATQKPSPEQQLLDFVLRWPQDTVRLNQLLVYGPRSIRKRRSAIDAAKVLVQTKWLVPLQTRRPDMVEWRIMRRPVIYPTIAT